MKTAFTLFLLVLSILGKPSSAQIVYENEFDSLFGWNSKYVSKLFHTDVAISGGYLILNPRASNKNKLFLNGPEVSIDFTKDFTIEASMAVYSDNPDKNTRYGIYFGASSNLINDNHNRFRITEDGYAQVASYTDPIDIHVTYTKCRAIKTGRGVFNKIKITKKGNQINFFANDVEFAVRNNLDMFGNRMAFEVSAGVSVAVDYLKVKYGADGHTTPTQSSFDINQQKEDKADYVGPQITITSPSVTRGLQVTESNKKITVTGKATDESGIYEVIVNGIDAKVDASGNFSATVPLAIGENNFTVTATDVKMNKGDYTFTVNRTASENIETPIIPVNNTEMTQGGKYYALIIGIEDYQDPTIPDLEEPVGDASSLSNILNTKYTFDKENIKLLKNPTRYQVFQALEALSKKVKESDNLLIFYAGHGYWDEQRKQGYWFPSDGRKTDRSSWITNADLKEYISTIPSKHTLLITDACFAGSIFKSRSIVSTASMAVKQLYELPSRKAMTSGSLKEVPDKSVFIEYLVKRLNQNAEKFLSAEQLFSSFRTAVINNSANGQVPQYGEIKEAGDEGGDFIFIKR